MLKYSKILILSLMTLLLIACTHITSPRISSELAYGKSLFLDGYYKRAMHDLLPLACDGNAEAQYAVGYMYYYGYGVAQDTDVGSFWINRSANQGFRPAINASKLIETNAPVPLHSTDKFATDRYHIIQASGLNPH